MQTLNNEQTSFIKRIFKEAEMKNKPITNELGRNEQTTVSPSTSHSKHYLHTFTTNIYSVGSNHYIFDTLPDNKSQYAILSQEIGSNKMYVAGAYDPSKNIFTGKNEGSIVEFNFKNNTFFIGELSSEGRYKGLLIETKGGTLSDKGVPAIKNQDGTIEIQPMPQQEHAKPGILSKVKNLFSTSKKEEASDVLAHVPSNICLAYNNSWQVKASVIPSSNIPPISNILSNALSDNMPSKPVMNITLPCESTTNALNKKPSTKLSYSQAL